MIKVFFLFYLLVSVPSSWGQSQNFKLVVSDRAIFRIEKDVFFKEALLLWVKEWSGLECVGRRSLMLQASNLNLSEMKSIPKLLDLLENRSPTTVEKQTLEKLVKFIKFMLYVRTQAQELSPPKSFSCIEKMSENLALVARSEAFLLQRFRESSSERTSWRETVSRAQAFIDSVVRGLTHEIFL